MSGEFDTSWGSIVEKLESQRRNLQNPDAACGLAQAVNDEGMFQNEIVSLCKRELRTKEKYPERRVVRLCDTFEMIDKFARRIEEAQSLEKAKVSGLIWASSVMTIKCGVEAGSSFDSVTSVVTELNKYVPSFHDNENSYPDEANVQTPLQDIFRDYIRGHLFFVDTFHKVKHRKGLDPYKDPHIKRKIKETAEAFNDAKREHSCAVKQAKEKIQARSFHGVVMRPKNSSLTNGDREGHPADLLVSQFQNRRWLGSGADGEVCEVEELSTGQFYARKQIVARDGRDIGDLHEHVMKEVSIMRNLRHRHIATVSLVVKEPDAYSIIMLPVADQNLRTYLDCCVKGAYERHMIKRLYSWFGSLVDALDYAHSMDVIHRDVKPANILIKEKRPFLSDFGCARDFTGQDASITNGELIQGTPLYLAPESEPGKAHGRPADVFALGCVFAEMLTVCRGKSLKEFQEYRKVKNEQCAFRSNLKGVHEWLKQFNEGNKLSDHVVEEIQDMLEEAPPARAKASAVHNSLKQDMAFFCA